MTKRDPTRVSYQCMMSRCNNPNDPDYKRYGAKGIKVCDRWQRSYISFLVDMGPRPPGMTIDRVDSKGNYEPGNCRWADSKTQNRHARRLITWGGETRTVGEWADYLGMNQTTLTMRLKKVDAGQWTLTQALFTPVSK